MSRRSAFTLIEILSTITIIAVLTTMVVFFTVGYIAYAQQNADKQTLTVLNDALTRYKCEGGNVNALTVGAPIGNVIAALQAPVNWSGMTHQFLQSSMTYPARSLQSVGNNAQYHFFQYNSYASETPLISSPTSTYPYGQGVGYLSNGGATTYSLLISTTSGYFAVKDSSGNITQHSQGGWYVAPATTGITIWSCASISDSTMSGTLTSLTCQSSQLTSASITGLTGLTSISFFVNLLASLDIHTLSNLQTLNLQNNPMLSLDASNLKHLTSIVCNYGYKLNAINVSGCTALQSLSIQSGKLTSLDISSCSSLTSMLQLDGNQFSGGTINSIFSALPTAAGVVSIPSNIGSTTCTPSIATNKGWSVVGAPPATLNSTSGVACFASASNTTLSVSATSSTGYVAAKDTTGNVTCSASGSITLTVTANQQFSIWPCISITDPTQNGNLTALSINNTCINSIDISKCTSLTTLSCANTYLMTLNASGLSNLVSLDCNCIGGVGVNYLSTINAGNCTSLATLYLKNNWGVIPYQITLTNDTSLTSVNIAGTNCSNSQSALNSIYGVLPTVSAGVISVGTSGATGSNTSIATAKGWTVSFTN